MQHLEGSGTPVLYIGRTVLKSSTQFLLPECIHIYILFSFFLLRKLLFSSQMFRLTEDYLA